MSSVPVRSLIGGVAILALAAASPTPAPAAATTLTPIGSYAQPVYVTSDPADPDRLFVVEAGGTIQLATRSGTSTFLDITDRVLSGGERGLLSAAFPADFPSSGRFYVFYTAAPSGDLQIDEFRANGDVAVPATRRPVLTVPHPTFGNHNGGQLQIGPDGYLYASTGDGGGSGDPGENAQDLGSRLGKILRLDPSPDGAQPYTVPPTNPFAGEDNDPVGGADDLIWSYGLRNPWRFSFDRATGALSIGDVGQAAWEELDYEPAPDAGRGSNFGWDCREGRHEFEPDGCGGLAFVDPIFEYPNPAGGAAAVVGGYVIRDRGLGDLYGRLIYADTYAGQLRSLIPNVPDASSDRSEGIEIELPVSFGEDACGRIYVVSLAGPVYRLDGPSAGACPAGPPPPAHGAPNGAGKQASTVALEAKRRRVRAGARARLRAIAAPCPQRAGDEIILRRNGRRIGMAMLGGRCRAQFRPRVRGPARYRAFIAETEDALAARSPRLRLKPRGERRRRFGLSR